MQCMQSRVGMREADASKSATDTHRGVNGQVGRTTVLRLRAKTAFVVPRRHLRLSILLEISIQSMSNFTFQIIWI
eukprot:2144119-Prorocentrum_lima.AAC.1